MKMRKMILAVAIGALTITGLAACGETTTTGDDVVLENDDVELDNTDVENDDVALDDTDVENDDVALDDTEVEGDDEAVVDELDVINVSEVLAGTVWIDEELTVYGFEVDGSTLFVTGQDGVQYTGEYAFVVSEIGAMVLGMSLPELDAQVNFIITAITETNLELMDEATGMVSVLVPVE